MMRPTRAVGRESADQPRERREIEQQPIDDNSGAGIPAQPDIDLGRQQTEEKDRHAAGDVVPVERPDILDRDGIGKHRAVGVKLQLIDERDDDECDRPAQTNSDHQGAQASESERMVGHDMVPTSPLAAHEG